jgi:hypothetical protein
MPVDPTIRRLAADPEIVLAIEVVNRFFEAMAERRDKIDPALAISVTTQEVIEDCWSLLKRGILRLKDDGDDDDDLIIQRTFTPGEAARARIVGSKLFAVRQYIRRLQNAKMDHPPIQRTEAARGTPTAH